MISLKTVDGVFLVATEDGMIDTTTGKSRDAFWQSLIGDGYTICLRSSHGKFLCVESDGNVLADRFVNSTWETFSVLPHPTNGGIALRSFHGNYLGFDTNSSSLIISETPVAWDGESMDLVFNKEQSAPVQHRIMRKYQTKSFVESQLRKYSSFNHATLSIVDAYKALLHLNGEKKMTNSPLLKKMLLEAENVRNDGHPDWLQLVCFL